MVRDHNGHVSAARRILAACAISAAFAGVAQDAAAARAAYHQQQAAMEVQRLAQQFDQLAANQESIVARMAKLEEGSAIGDLRAEIAALKAQMADLRHEQDAMRREIVADLAKRLAALPRPAPAPVAAPPPPPPPRTTGRKAPPPPKPSQPEFTGSYYEHEVKPGQTLSEISKGFDVPIKRILLANPGLNPNALRVGQKIKVPADDAK